MNLHEAKQAWLAHSALHAQRGVILQDSVNSYLPAEFKRNFNLAMDAQPALSTDPSAGIPVWLSTMIDPAIFEILFSPVKAAEIFGEEKRGSWTTKTMMFPTVEHTGEVSSYGDYNMNGSTGMNAIFPQRQSYLFQTIKEYGEKELDEAGLAKLNLVSEIDKAAATVLNRFANLTYFYGVSGLQNYGLLNDPNLSSALTPALKAYGGTAWDSAGVTRAQATEIFTDIQTTLGQLIGQTAGLVDEEDSMTLAMSPSRKLALTTTNSFGLSVNTMLKENFPGLKIETAVQYGAKSSTNPAGAAAGETMQLFVDAIEGQDVGYCSFNEKMRAHKIIPDMSSFRQKVTAGTWGAIIRMPLGIAQMVGI